MSKNGRKIKGDVVWTIPTRKKPIAYSTRATSDLIVALAEDGSTIREIYQNINYDREAKDIMQKYIELGFGDTVAKTMFR
jgi:hypothetical protein